MAQATKQPAKSKAKGSTAKRGKSATSRNGSKAKASASRAKSPSTPTKRRSSQSSPRAQSKNGAGAVKDTAVERTKAAGHAIAGAASKAKTPLIAGGTALAGAAVGAAVKDRVDSSKGPLKRLRSSSIAKPAKNLGKVDVGTVKSVADRVTTYGQRASDIATAVEKTRKKNK
jgi:hypothetical protein